MSTYLENMKFKGYKLPLEYKTRVLQHKAVKDNKIMTVYNITKVIDNTLLNSIKVYLNADKVTVLYTDWGNKFGVRVSDKFHNASKERLNIISKVLWNKLSLKPITMFTNCPKVDVHNASLIKQYGRTYKK